MHREGKNKKHDVEGSVTATEAGIFQFVVFEAWSLSVRQLTHIFSKLIATRASIKSALSVEKISAFSGQAVRRCASEASRLCFGRLPSCHLHREVLLALLKLLLDGVTECQELMWRMMANGCEWRDFFQGPTRKYLTTSKAWRKCLQRVIWHSKPQNVVTIRGSIQTQRETDSSDPQSLNWKVSTSDHCSCTNAPMGLHGLTFLLFLRQEIGCQALCLHLWIPRRVAFQYHFSVLAETYKLWRRYTTTSRKICR